jgi:CRP/FNR family transcriptional regulator, cyclic AMP receptor protein
MIGAPIARPTVSARARILASTPLFALLGSDDLEALAQTTGTAEYERGDVIFRKGDAGYRLFVIVNGAVKISVLSHEGTGITLATLTAGQFFGELALFDEQPRSADAEAIESTEVLVLQRSDLLRVLEERPRATILQLLQALSQRLRATDELLQDAAFLDIPARTAKRLLELGEAHGERTLKGTRIKLRLTQQDLASMIGARRENVNRALAYYQSRGWLAHLHGYFTILDEAQLRARSS